MSVPHLLTRTSHRTRGHDGIAFLGELSLAKARVHEFCGTARRTLALSVARAMQGQIFWIRPGWAVEHLNGAALPPWIDPGRVITLSPRRPEDLLWTMEEALRAGVVPLVVGDISGPPGLTAVRRLHLAAETGAAEGDVAPVGILLTATGEGAPGVETRWRLTPNHGANGHSAWRLDRLRARTLPPATWQVAKTGNGTLTLSKATAAESVVS
ncbi:MAG: hypothetical protein AAGA87_08785 [Pseudomonadota bacterium]